jgi:membrane protein DedA with SNARE-associated domain
MPWWRYVPGVVVGALFWATIYTTIGFAVLEAWFGERPWPWIVGGVLAILVVVGATWLVRRRRAARLPSAP